MITINLAFKEWGTVFPGAACVGALVDRFVERCHVIDIDVDVDVDSWRQKRAAALPAPRSPRKPVVNLGKDVGTNPKEATTA